MRTCGLCVLLLAVVAHGHDLYLLPERFSVKPGERLRVRVHNGDSFPRSGGPPVMARVRDVEMRTEAGGTAVEGLAVRGRSAEAVVTVPDSNGVVLRLRTVPNFIELKAAEFTRYLRGEGLQQVIDLRRQAGHSARPGRETYSKSAKALVRVEGRPSGHGVRTGDTLEIVPEADPFGMSKGGELPVLVLLRGKPASGLQVEAMHSFAGEPGRRSVVGRTDADGRVRVRIAGPGVWKLHAVAMERSADAGRADWESHWASLTFGVGR